MNIHIVLHEVHVVHIGDGFVHHSVKVLSKWLFEKCFACEWTNTRNGEPYNTQTIS